MLGSLCICIASILWNTAIARTAREHEGIYPSIHCIPGVLPWLQLYTNRRWGRWVYKWNVLLLKRPFLYLTSIFYHVWNISRSQLVWKHMVYWAVYLQRKAILLSDCLFIFLAAEYHGHALWKTLKTRENEQWNRASNAYKYNPRILKCSVKSINFKGVFSYTSWD